MISHLQDGHGYIEHAKSIPKLRPPVWVDMIEGQVIVVGSSTPDVSIGDVLVKIDGVPVSQVWTKHSAEICASTEQWCSWRLCGHSQLLFGPSGSSVTLELLNASNTTYEVTLKRSLSSYIGRERTEPNPTHLSEMKPGIFYVDLCQITAEEVAPTSPFMSQVISRGQGLVCDIRGYPTGAALELIKHLSNTPIEGVPCTSFYSTQPDRKGWVESSPDYFTLPPSQPHLKMKVVFLSCGRAISYAEVIHHFI